jgi:ubiquinone/menaquinone biosynthesis C-methylase UbiE
MGIAQSLLMRMFGRPQGALGRLGGIIMARTNYDCGAWIIELLEVRPNDRVLEVGFGSGVIIQQVAAVAACVAGVDLSQEMVEQARARNAGAVLSRRVELRRGSVESLPYDRNTFDAALAINSFQVWQNAVAGLREIHRVMKPGGRVALGFTPYSGQSKKGLMEMLAIADFTSVQIVNGDHGFCALGSKPDFLNPR